MAHSKINSLLGVNPDVKKAFVHFPDVILFQYTADEYRSHWNTLAKSRYLWSNGHTIKPANWFRYAFQSIKGWFGFTNYCHSELVTMSLKKLAYYGYVEEYAQEALGTMKYYPLKEQFISLVSKKRNDETTKELQQDLITYFTRCTYSTNEFNSWNYIYTFTSYNDKKIFGARDRKSVV